MDPLLTEGSAEEMDRIPEPDQGTGRETQHKHTHVNKVITQSVESFWFAKEVKKFFIFYLVMDSQNDHEQEKEVPILR